MLSNETKISTSPILYAAIETLPHSFPEDMHRYNAFLFLADCKPEIPGEFRSAFLDLVSIDKKVESFYISH